MEAARCALGEAVACASHAAPAAPSPWRAPPVIQGASGSPSWDEEQLPLRLGGRLHHRFRVGVRGSSAAPSPWHTPP